MRKMASIRKISSISPIPGADNIEVARIDGWNVVVRKGEFKAGDLCVYCEIDSLLPGRPEFEFMRPRRFRVKTIKLRGQISQGLVFPLDIIPEYKQDLEQDELEFYPWPDKYKEGDDVSEVLGIIKWEPQLPASLAGHTMRTFPGFLPKTDEERVQNLGNVIEARKGTECYMTEKLHGTSITCYIRDGVFGVCSRNNEKKDEEGCTYWATAKKEKIEEKLRAIGLENVACQGELCGPGINKNTLGLKEHEIFIFDFFNVDRYRYFDPEVFVKRAQEIGFKLVPILKVGFILDHTVDELVEMVNGMKTVFPSGKNAEGVVIRALSESNTDRLSFKVINNAFLIENNE